jgi:AraC-like DNA-binding protein
VLKKPCYYKRFYMVIPGNIFAHHITSPLAPLLRRTGGSSARLMLSPESSDQIKQMLYDIAAVCRSEQSGSGELTHTKIYAKMLQLLCMLSEKCTSVQIAGEHINTSALPSPIRDVLPYIENNVARISSVSELADAVHVPAPYLSAVFRKHIGVPLVSYLQARKIALAKQLLEEGRSVTYACYESGFSDCSYFIRIFKRHIGMTPLQYRNSFREDKE